ncbi:MAG: DUF2231 domain-containing protein [Chloroflexota bacterium]
MEFINRLIHTLTEVHPLHPMLVHFPIALTGAGALFILIAAWRKNNTMEQAAFANIILAFLGAIAAAATGILSNLENYDGAAPNAMVKISLATLFLIITGTTIFARWRNPGLLQGSTKILYISAYLISFAIVLVLAFLGGVILYGF